MLRRSLVILVLALIAIQVVRNAAVQALALRSPDAAARVWPGHPGAELALAMRDIGRSAQKRQAPSQAVFASILDAARKAPLAPEPFVVRGVQQQLSGNSAIAIEALVRAERRNARSLPARYFLADLYYHAGDSRRSLEEIGALSRLAPGGDEAVAPYIAVYASDRSTWPDLRALFRANPGLEDASLTALAADPANADTILALADPKRPMAQARWPSALMRNLISAGDYARARAVWATAWDVRNPSASLLYDEGFRDSRPGPPFNWVLGSSTVGLAERQAAGRLHVIYYGRDDGVLASELVLLQPATYRMSLAVAGDSSGSRSLSWSIRCDGTKTPFASASLDVAAADGWTFTVPADCRAQWIALSGRSGDVARQSELTLSALHLKQVP